MIFEVHNSHGLLAEFRLSLRVFEAIVFPARHSSQLVWAIYTLVADVRIVPMKALEVFASILKGLIDDGVTVAVFVRVRTTYHPSCACLRRLEGRFVLVRITSVVLTGSSPVKARSCNIEMSPVVALLVGWRAVVCSFDNDN